MPWISHWSIKWKRAKQVNLVKKLCYANALVSQEYFWTYEYKNPVYDEEDGILRF